MIVIQPSETDLNAWFSLLMKVKKKSINRRSFCSYESVKNFLLVNNENSVIREVFSFLFFLLLTYTQSKHRDFDDCRLTSSICFIEKQTETKSKCTMAQRSSSLANATIVGTIAQRWQNIRPVSESTSQSSNDNQGYTDRQRLLSAKVERCVQELVERVYKRNSTLNFELLAPPSSHLSWYLLGDSKEFYFDFYLVWKNSGQIEIERDSSSICCQIKSLDRQRSWSRAEQERLLIVNKNRKRSTYLNGRGLRDLFFEILHEVSPDLIRLDFLEHLIYFDLIIPTLAEKSTCHVTLLPCIHRPDAHEVLLPFGTLRWYPRSLLPLTDKSSLFPFQQQLQYMSIRRYISTTEVVDETTKLTRKDQQDYARARAIIHELFLPTTLAHVDSIEQIQGPFEHELKIGFFLPHRFDRNCNVFPAGQQLLNDRRAKRLFREFLRTNIKVTHDETLENTIEGMS